MSGLLGGGNKNATVITKYTQLDVQTSAQGLALPILWGQRAIAGNLINAGNFKAIPQGKGGKKGGGGGGKGGGGNKKGTATSYDYKIDAIWALCEGPIQGIASVYFNQLQLTWPPTGINTVPDILFDGFPGQPPWNDIPGDSLGYSSTACVAGSDIDMGSTPVLPQYRFEVIGLFANSIPGNIVDANPADVVNDFVTNPQYGIGLGPPVGNAGSFIDNPSWSLYHTYCQAQRLLLSPVLDTQEQISQIIKRWADLTNTWIFWSGGVLKFVPLGDNVCTDGLVVYTPNNTAVADLDYEDYVFEKGQQPVTVTIIDPADRPNTVKLEIIYREGFYNAYPVEWKDQALVDQYGQINAPVAPAHDCCEPGYGAIMAQLIGQRAAYIARSYGFKLGWEWYWLEPGDVLTLTEPHIGMNQWPVRIRTLDEDDKGFWTVVAEEFPAGLPNGAGTGSSVNPQQPQPGSTTQIVNQLTNPGNVNPPAVFEPQSTFTNGTAQVWIGASGGLDWGGANAYISFDGVNYAFVGPIVNAARQGVLTADLPNHADPDTTDTLAVDLTRSQGTFSGNSTSADADADRTLCLVTAPFSTAIPCVGEFVSYGTTTLTSLYNYALTYLRRGQLGTATADWPAGSLFSRIDLGSMSGQVTPTLLTYNLPVQYIGHTIYLKFTSFNKFGLAVQDISTVTAYTYVPCGLGYGTGPGGVPSTPIGLTATGEIGGVLLQWNASPAADNVVDYQLWRAPGLSASFSSASLIATTPATAYLDTGLAAGSQWTYFLIALNAVGASNHTGGVNATVLSAAQNAWYQAFSVGGTFASMATDSWDGNYEIFDVQAPVALTFPANFSTSPTPGCEVAPGATVTITFQTIHSGTPTTVGTLTINSSATTGSYSVSPGFTLPAGDRLRAYAPSAVDTTIAGLFGTIVATR
jgi:hypothetical protein